MIRAQGPGLPTQAWPAGTVLDQSTEIGGRVGFYHRGYYFLRSYFKGGNDALIDLSNGKLDVVQLRPGGGNSHVWHKFGDLVILDIDNFQECVEAFPSPFGSSRAFLDCSNMLDRKPVLHPKVSPDNSLYNIKGTCALRPFPHSFTSDGIRNAFTNEVYSDRNVRAETGLPSSKTLRIGDLLIQMPEEEKGGLATWDLGDPSNPVLLDVLPGAYFQYTTAAHIWSHYIVLLNGGDAPNGPNGENMVVVDFSDPTDLKYAWGKSADEIGGPRYIKFQDEFGFLGTEFDGGRKIDMRTGETVLQYECFGDFWHDPIGHLLITTEGQTSGNKVKLVVHQDGLDTRPPFVAYHWPRPNATNVPVTGNVGLVVHETLDDITVNNDTVLIRPVNGGTPVECDIFISEYDVLQFAPQNPLQDNTTYIVELVDGGIKDATGNGVEPWSFRFSTGNDLGDGGGTVGTNTPPSIASTEVIGGNRQPAGNITLVATGIDDDGDPLEYRWDFGNGTAATSWSSQNSITQNLPPGIYTVSVQVRDGRGGQASQVIRIVLFDPSVGEGTPTARQSNQVAIQQTYNLVWVVNPDNDTISAISSKADVPSLQREVSVGKTPTSIAVGSDGSLWVTCKGDDSVEKRDGQTGELLGSIPFDYGAAPVSIVINPSAENQAFVAEAGSGYLRELLLDEEKFGRELFLGATPEALAVKGDGSNILVTKRITEGLAGTIWEVSVESFELTKSISLPADTTTQDTPVSSRGVPNYVNSVTMHPTQDLAWYGAKKDNIFRGLNRDGKALTFESTLRALFGQVDLGEGQELVDRRLDIDNHGQPSFVYYSPLGTHILALFQGNNRMRIYDAVTGFQQASIDVGASPQALAVDPDTQRVFVKNFLGRSVSIIEAAGFLQGEQSEEEVLTTVKTVQNETLSSQVLLGKTLFYSAADPRLSEDHYISCAACHDDGGHDGQVWDFGDRGEGLRSTTDLRGRAGMAHGLLHWSGNFDELQDFEGQIRQDFGGLGLMSDSDFFAGTRSEPLGDAKAGISSDLDALAAYMTSLREVPKSPHRTATGEMTASAKRGEEIFSAANCADCHTGTKYTDSRTELLHNVGTLKPTSGQRLGENLSGIDTPGLRGVWDGAPYFHDGSALTLEQVIEQSGTDHGGMASLSTSQRSDLVAYLLQLDASNENPSAVEPPAPEPIESLTIQAEDGIWVGAAALLTQFADYEGEGYVGRFDGTSAGRLSVTFQNVPEGRYTLEVRYATFTPQWNTIVINGTSFEKQFAASGENWVNVSQGDLELSGNVLVEFRRGSGYTFIDSFTLVPESLRATGVSISEGQVSLEVGETRKIEARIWPVNATNQDRVWASTNPAVASVDAAGRVTGQSVGTATISVTTSDGGFQAMTEVRVSLPTINPPSNGGGTRPGEIVFGGTFDSVSGQDDNGTTPLVSSGGQAVRLLGNTWKRVPTDYVIGPNTMVEFTVEASDVGEIIGLGFTEGKEPLDEKRSILIGGSDVGGRSYESWSVTLPSDERYQEGSGQRSYTISLGEMFQGRVNYLILIADDDATNQTDVTYSRIRLYEKSERRDETYLDGNNRVVFGRDGDSYGTFQDGQNGRSSSLAVSEDGGSARLEGNAWKIFPLSYQTTGKTMMDVTVRSENLGEIVGISLDDDSGANEGRRAFLLGGREVDGTRHSHWSFTLENRLSSETMEKTFTIPVGELYNEPVAVKFIGLVGDDDLLGQANVTFSNVRIYESDESPDQDNYAGWSIRQNWPDWASSLKGEADDPDGDGLTNRVERALGTDPLKADGQGKYSISLSLSALKDEQTFTMTYEKVVNDEEYELVHSSDLQNWSAAGVSSESFDSSNGTYQRSFTTSDLKKFAKLRLVKK